MPKWVKIVQIVVGTLFVLLIAAGFLGARAIKSAALTCMFSKGKGLSWHQGVEPPCTPRWTTD